MRETPAWPKCSNADAGALPGELCPVGGAPSPAARGTGGTEPSRPPTVLCIDDDPLVLHFYRDFLNAHGYRTVTATDGLQGIALATQDRPDVILLDVMLRGLSGYDICRKVRADTALRDIPIILITVWDQPNVPETGRAAGATRTLCKPADPENLLTTIAQVLGQTTSAPTGVA